MTCKKCGAQMRLWLERPAFKTYQCPSCEFVAIEAAEPERKDVST